MPGADSTSDDPTTSPAVVTTLAGVRGYTVCHTSGRVVEVHGLGSDSERVVGISAELTKSLINTSSLLGIGVLQAAALRADNRRWVLGFRDDYAIVVDVELNTRMAIVEFAVGLDDWVPKTPGEFRETVETVEESDFLEVSPSPSSDPGNGVESATGPIAPLPPDRLAPPAPERRPISVNSAVSLTPLNLARTNARGLRHALAKGDLPSVRSIAEHLRHAYSSGDDLCGSGTSAPAILPLMAGIACVLVGNGRSALRYFIDASKVPSIGDSLAWAALYWSARAAVHMPRGLDAALNIAKKAALVSKRLDLEVRALSARLLVELFIERREPAKANQFLGHYRRFLEDIDTEEDSAEAAWLESKILHLSGDTDGAHAAAERAYTSRLGWAQPLTWLCRHALATSNVAAARDLVAPLLAHGSKAPEHLRLARLIAEVQGGRVAPNAAAELLGLNDAPPEPHNLVRLVQLAQSYPDVAVFHETLGWSLLKHGDWDDARRAFSLIEAVDSLPDDTCASLHLGLGCLAAIDVDHSNSGARLRAIIDAIAESRRQLRPAVPADETALHVVPADLQASLTLPSLNATSSVSNGLTHSSFSCLGSPILVGALSAFCVTDLLELLDAGRSSGVLILGSVRGVGAVDIREGAITGAMAPSSPRLSDSLLSRERATVEDFERAAAIQLASAPQLPIGTIMVREGWLAQEELEAALRSQAEQAIAELMDWCDGLFAFCPELGSDSARETAEIAANAVSVLGGLP